MLTLEVNTHIHTYIDTNTYVQVFLISHPAIGMESATVLSIYLIPCHQMSL